MAKEKSKRELKLQKKLIPLNIVVCILALVAALTLFLTPILRIDIGKILNDKGVKEFADDQIEELVGDLVSDSDQNVDYSSVVKVIVNNILDNAEGKISVSAVGALHVLTSDDKGQEVLDELFFNDNALVTKLINSVVDGVVGLFDTEAGQEILEETIISSLTDMIVKGINDSDFSGTLSSNDVKDLVNIFKELGDTSKVVNGKVDAVADDIINKIEMSFHDVNLSDADKEEFTKTIQDLYDDTLEALVKEGKGAEDVTIESVICVAISKNVELSDFNIGEMLGGLFGGNDEDDESSVHIKSIDKALTEGEGSDGSSSDDRTIVTNFNGLLAEMGLDDTARANLKEEIRTTLRTEIDKILDDANIDEYLEYYGYIFYGMLVFIVPWLILFLFSLLHIFTSNKRFMMWYVKLLCWIPSVIWLALKLVPVVINKVAPDAFDGDSGPIVKAALNGITSFTWINGLCYVLLWLVSIFWAFPIKHKIRKERRHPAVEDDDDYDSDYGDDYDSSADDVYAE